MFNLLYDSFKPQNTDYDSAERVTIWERDAHYLYFGNNDIGYFNLPQPWTYYMVYSARYEPGHVNAGFDKLYGILVSPVRMTKTTTPGWFPILTNTYGGTQCTPAGEAPYHRETLKEEKPVELLQRAYGAWSAADANQDGRWYYDKIFHEIARRIGRTPLDPAQFPTTSYQGRNQHLAAIFGYLEGLSLHQMKRTLWRDFDPDDNPQDSEYQHWNNFDWLISNLGVGHARDVKYRVLETI